MPGHEHHGRVPSKQPRTRELERLGTYLWSVEQLYQSVVSILDDPVEQRR
jgi:hypothetical protein